jgi:hypothetical protein
MLDSILDYIAARMQEPSTWVSLGTLGTGVGIVIAPEYWQAIMGIGMIVGGLLGTILRERKKTTPAEIKSAVEVLVKPEATKPASISTVEAAMKNGK